jgi:predicted XRE-type DNA-binding protein
MQEPIVQSSGNGFTDLGFDPAEAAILQLRSKRINDLRGFIQTKQLTQAQAVEQMALHNLEFRTLMRGKHDKFSLEMLIALEARTWT